MDLSQHALTKHVLFLGFISLLAGACASSPPSQTADAGTIAPPPLDANVVNYCDLPGSVQYTANGVVQVAGPNTAKVGFMHLPTGFCAHYFGNVGNTRQLRFAPGGELVVASPTTGTTGGGANGMSAIVFLPDDDRDGYADTVTTFLGDLPSTQGRAIFIIKTALPSSASRTSRVTARRLVRQR
jgi:hypothetical protein